MGKRTNDFAFDIMRRQRLRELREHPIGATCPARENLPNDTYIGRPLFSRDVRTDSMRQSRRPSSCALAPYRKPAKGASHSRVDIARVDAIRVARPAPSGSGTARFECVATVAYDHLLFAAIAPAAVQMNCAASAAPTSDVPTPAVRIAAGQRRSVSAASAPVASRATVLVTKPIA